jgi:hypothetical protein
MQQMKRVSKAITITTAAVALAGGCTTTPENTGPKASTPSITVTGLATPESVLHDTARDVYFVSNINGAPTAKDDNGFISKVSPTGEVLALKFIDGAQDGVTLHAPKGMGLVGDRLLVADIDVIRSFDITTGALLDELPVDGATFLNDIATNGNTVVISDTGLTHDGTNFAPSGSDALYVLDVTSNALSKIVQGGEVLPRANGVAIVDGSIFVAYFGAPRIDRFDLKGAALGQWTLPAGSLAGLVSDGAGGFYVSSWESQSVYAVSAAGEAKVIKQGLAAPADIALDAGRKVLLVPRFMDNIVEVHPL